MHAYISSGFCRSEVWHSVTEFSAQGMTQPQSGIGQAEFLSRGAEKKFTFKPILVGRIQLLVVVGLRILLSVWLSQERCSQLLNLIPISCYVAPPFLRCKWCVESFPCFKFLTFSSATSRRKPLYFWRVPAIRSAPPNYLYFKANWLEILITSAKIPSPLPHNVMKSQQWYPITFARSYWLEAN